MAHESPAFRAAHGRDVAEEMTPFARQYYARAVDGDPEGSARARSLSAMSLTARSRLPAQYELAMCYRAHLGVPRDERNEERAHMWLLRAAKSGFGPAVAMCHSLGCAEYSHDKELALTLLRCAARRGDAAAQAAISEAYETGNGVFEDHAQAFMWAELAARQGNLAGSG